jgi:hypothetical protein
LNVNFLFRAGLEQLTILQLPKCELFVATFQIKRSIAPVSAWVDEMNAGNRSSWVSLPVGEQNTLRARIPFSCGAVDTKITTLFGFAASIRIAAAVALLYVRGDGNLC